RIARGQGLENVAGQRPLPAPPRGGSHLGEDRRRRVAGGKLLDQPLGRRARLLPFLLVGGHDRRGAEHLRRRGRVGGLRENRRREPVEVRALALVPQHRGDAVLGGGDDGGRAPIARLHELALGRV